METGLSRRTARNAFYDVAVSSRPRYGRITNVGHVAAPCREERRLLGGAAVSPRGSPRTSFRITASLPRD